jgi:hypothetical protein
MGGICANSCSGDSTGQFCELLFHANAGGGDLSNWVCFDCGSQDSETSAVIHSTGPMGFSISYTNFTECRVNGHGAVCESPSTSDRGIYLYGCVTNCSGASMYCTKRVGEQNIFEWCWFVENSITDGTGHALLVSETEPITVKNSRFIHDDITLIYCGNKLKLENCQFSGNGPTISYELVGTIVTGTAPASFTFTYLDTEPCANAAIPFVPESPRRTVLFSPTSAITESRAFTLSLTLVPASQSPVPSDSQSTPLTVSVPDRTSVSVSVSASAQSSPLPEITSIESTSATEDSSETTAVKYVSESSAPDGHQSSASLWWLGVVVPVVVAGVAAAVVLVLRMRYAVEYTYEEEEAPETETFSYTASMMDGPQGLLGHDFENPLDAEGQAEQVEIVE